MNCSNCDHCQPIKFYEYRNLKQHFVKNRYYCTHPEQKSHTPWIVRGCVVKVGNCDSVKEYGECPLESSLNCSFPVP